jgi:hypothetical protein
MSDGNDQGKWDAAGATQACIRVVARHSGGASLSQSESSIWWTGLAPWEFESLFQVALYIPSYPSTMYLILGS